MTKERQVEPRQAPQDAQRIVAADGAMLADPTSIGNWLGAADEEQRAVLRHDLSPLFDPAFWARRGELTETVRGRGSSWFVASAGHWVLRHYLRGGWIARFSYDRYLWHGERHVRAFAEWRLLALLAGRGLPVPKPIAARYRRTGMFYRCDLITQRIADAEPLSTLLARGAVAEETWRAVGAAVARLHAAGVDHADLNAHNLLLDGRGSVSIIDFDRGRCRPAGAWAADNLSRLHRSLIKITRELPPARFSAAAWDSVLAGYAPASARRLSENSH